MIKKYIQKNYINLCSPVMGTKIYDYSDQFFGLASRMLKDEPPVFKDGVYDKNGKWMDGWETRRKRSNGNDYLIIKLGKPGLIKNIDIDTSFFNGNQPEYISLEGSNSVILKNDRNVIWKKIIKKSKVFPNKNNQFKSTTNSTFKYIKLNIFFEFIILNPCFASGFNFCLDRILDHLNFFDLLSK